ncbi:GIY-YIG nuclease family protein [Caulobacter sp.]|uniref:GIY-YIG nuclease family protein n=1 Tax=Caulobacter sp. TaxID=78 RepID=UPI001B1E4064|nr:GIY-YIG nuclease family protein [Caulobacter sp.]MBO9543590.1 GIY-YIG nuclease family protein [Caulobacter sp.]
MREERYIAVYIMANQRLGTLYIGASGDLNRRIWEHREGLIPGFTKKYGLKRLVWYEPHDDMGTAFQRERSLKRWPRQWKINLIERENPDWDDLYASLV